jgi:hypothetical protein
VSIPQKILTEFALEGKIPVLDLLPILRERAQARGAKPENYFFSESHLSPLGNEVVAEIIANFLHREGLITHAQARSKGDAP